MRLLVVSRTFPAPDRTAGDLRFSRLLALIGAKWELFFCATATAWQQSEVGVAATARYRQQIIDSGINVISDTVPEALRSQTFDAVIFEFYDVAAKYLGFVRSIQPNCRIVVDTVDLHYERLMRGAKLTGKAEDFEKAKAVQAIEIATYGSADLLIAVTKDEKDKLAALGLGAAIVVVPTINTIHPLTEKPASLIKRMLFVGSFTHAPNEDAIIYFCAEVLPRVLDSHPDATLTIVGNAPTEKVKQLATSNVTVIGYVPDMDPLLHTHGISVAPLRFGAGLKGKICEAMGAGLAVVTTTIGAEGMGLTPGIHAAVSDTARGFAHEINTLIADPKHFEAMRVAGRQFLSEYFGAEAVGKAVRELCDMLERVKPKGLSYVERSGHQVSLWRFLIKLALHRRILWRLK